MGMRQRFGEAPRAAEGRGVVSSLGLLLWLAVGALALALLAAPFSGAPRLVLGICLGFGSLAVVTTWRWAEERRAHLYVAREQRRQAGLLRETRRIARLGDWALDVDTGRVHWSDEVFRIYGQAPCAELQLQDVAAWVHPDDRPMLPDAIARILDTGEPFQTEFRILRPDGEVRTIHARAEWT